jgi:hypothetical protein
VKRALLRFALTPARPEPLAVLRIGIAVLLLTQAACIAPALFELYSRSGVIGPELYHAFVEPTTPGLAWLGLLLERSGRAETPILLAFSTLYVLSLSLLGLGLRTRIAAAVAWVLHLSLSLVAPGTQYGADQFADLALFYLVVVPCGDALSLDRRMGTSQGLPSWQARLGLRLIQIHLAFAYLAAGISKAQGGQWWSGEAIWRAAMLPEYAQLDFSWLAAVPLVPMALGWATLAVEIGYPIFIWPRRTRRPWVLMTIAMHAAIAAFLGLHLFGAMMALLTFSAFGVDAEPRIDSATS